ncbi:mini-circle protein [Mangrovactinospora gilvigrisea]|uniref:Mini-circle protein n=1 Tax=Mangrovactinospora gilvigrisea TaxID=1428644 RepID=A0A1J7CFC1_9ACTN|nr:DinB family protein [Mangrovactinospora gilvigrisea]OIV38394.1 mini-circle protein [Mangrovactinospora gilvigrisea]
MAIIDEQGRTEPPVAVDETGTLLGFLDYQRQTLEWKCRGLDAAAFRATTASSSMTLGGLLKHMAFVEDHWFGHYLHGLDRAAPFAAVDWEAEPDWEWTSAAADGPDALRTLWSAAVERSRALTADALADGGMSRPARRSWPDGLTPSLRWIVCHMIEEYARHNGHADLLRESIDGETGE